MKTLITAEQLSRPVPGGIGTYIRGLLRGLDQLDYAPSLLVAKGGRQDVDATYVDVEEASLSSRLLTPAWDVGFGVPKSAVDVVHATSLAMPPSKQPLTVMVHDLAWRSYPEAFTRRGRKWHESALQRAIKKADVLIVPSTQTENDLRSAGVSRERLRLIAHGYDHLPKPDYKTLDEKLARHGLTAESRFLLTVGTLEPRKNLERLLRAYEKASTDFEEPVPLLIVGRVGWGAQIEPVPGVVIINDATDQDLAGLYESCEAMVYVPLSEGYGLPVIEAMSFGAPVIASAVPSAGDVAFRVDPLNVAAIAEALHRVTSDTALRNSLGRRGREHATKVTWRASAEQHLKLWKSLA